MISRLPQTQGANLAVKIFIFLLIFAAVLSMAFAVLASPSTFVTKWGTSGTGNGQFQYPKDVAVDPTTGDVYVADADNHRIQKFDSSGSYLTKWGSNGTGDGQFKWPAALTVDSTGNVYVADSDNNRVQKFSSTGTYMTQWGGWGYGAGYFQGPFGITVDTSSNVYVTDSSNHLVQKFSSTGTYITQWGGFWDSAKPIGSGNGKFKFPEGVAVDSSSNVYVVDRGNDRIQKFSSSGTYITQWGETGGGDGKFYEPDGIAVDSSNNVYVADRMNHRIQMFSSSGSFLDEWGSLGGSDGKFNYPRGVAADLAGNVFVADTQNDRIQKFNDPASTPPFTSLAAVPASPDGDSGWYKTDPSITLTPNETATTYYAFDTTSSFSSGPGPVGPINIPTDGEHIIYYYSVDIDNNTETVRDQSYKLDTADPTDPGLLSPSHTTGTPSFDNTVDINISGATDTASGVDGFSTSWSQGSTETPDATLDMQETGSSTTSPSLADGSWYFNLRTKDNAGNWTSTVHIGPFAIDTAVPSTFLSTSPTIDGDNGWFKTSPSITLTADEPGATYYQWDSTSPAGWSAYGGNFAGVEGAHTLYYFSADTANNTETTQNQAFKVDTGAPVDPISVASPSHNVGQWSAVSTVTVDFAGATDTVSGVEGYAISWSKDGTETPPTTMNLTATGSATETTSSFMTDGTWWFNLRTKDKAGNWTATIHLGPFKIEANPPETTITLTPDGDNGWYKTNPTTITLTPDETATTYYSWDDTASPNMGTAVPVSHEGTKTLFYYSVDTVGNTETPAKSTEIQMDSVDPTDPLITGSTPTTNTWTKDNTVEVNWSVVADTASGVDGFSVSWSQDTTGLPGETKTIEETVNSTTSPPLADGSWYFNLRTKDNAGNWTTTVHEGPFKIDTTAPTGSVLINSGAAYTKSTAVTLNLTASDGAGSGVSWMNFKNDGGAWSGWEPYASTRGWTLPSVDGTKKVWVMLKDAAENELPAEVSDTILLDTKVPVANKVTSPRVSTRESKTTSFKVKWSASDAPPTSGIKNYDVQYKIGKKGPWTNWRIGTTSKSKIFKGKAGNTYYIRVRATDNAGNIGKYSKDRWTIVPYDNGQQIRSRHGFAGKITQKSSRYYKKTIRFSKTTGDRIVYRFTGNKVYLIATKAKKRNKARIYIDGKYKKTINTISSKSKYRQEVYYFTFRKVGTHNLKIVNVGNKDRLDLDGLAVRR